MGTCRTWYIDSTHLRITLMVGPYACSSELSYTPNISSSKKKCCTLLRAPPPPPQNCAKVPAHYVIFALWGRRAPPLSELCKAEIFFAQNPEGGSRGVVSRTEPSPLLLPQPSPPIPAKAHPPAQIPPSFRPILDFLALQRLTSPYTPLLLPQPCLPGPAGATTPGPEKHQTYRRDTPHLTVIWWSESRYFSLVYF